MASERGAELLLDDARWMLERQERNLDTLRSKVATIFAGTTVVTAVFAQAYQRVATPSHVARLCFGLALSLFVVTVVCCVIVLWPWTFAFSHDLREWIDDADHGRDEVDPELTALTLASRYEKHRYQNVCRIKWLHYVFTVACALLGLQALLWAGAVG